MRTKEKDLSTVKIVAMAYMDKHKGDITQDVIEEWDNIDMQIESDLDYNNSDDKIQVVLLDKGLVSVYVEHPDFEYYGSCYFKLNEDTWEPTEITKG